jgi:RNA polymerase sigma-70 factor (ECF subfamily)
MVIWPEIMKQHGPLVWQTALRLLCHEADASDCFQNVFREAVALARKETILNWPALLKRLATTRAINRLRQRRREAIRVRPLDGDPAPSREPTPAQAAEGSELAERLRQALADIEPRQALIFSLACLDGWAHQEIAAQLGITATHVRVLLSRARAELRVRLRAFDPADNPDAISEAQP